MANRLMQLFVEVTSKIDPRLERDLAGVEQRSQSTEKSASGIGDAFQDSSKRSRVALAATKKDVTNLANEAKKASKQGVSLKSEIKNAKQTTATLDNIGRKVSDLNGENIRIDVDVDQDSINRVKNLSGSMGELTSSVRQFKTASAAFVGIPAIIAGIGGLAPAATAAAGATAQLGLGLGQAAAGFGLIGGTALAGAQVGLRGYTAAIRSTVEASREAYEATHELQTEQVAKERQDILNTKASTRFNEQINKSIIGFSRLQAAIGNAVFPTFTRELGSWTGIMGRLTPAIARTSGELAKIAAEFSKFVRTAQDGRLLQDTFEFINGSAIRAAQALSELGQAGLRVFQRLIPFAHGFQLQVVRVAESINKWTQNTANLNKVSSIFTTLQQRMTQVEQIAKNLGLAFIDIFRALNQGGMVDDMMRGLVELTAAFRNLMSGGGGANAITSFMQQAKPALLAMRNLAIEAARQFLILSNNVVKAGPGIGTLAQVINALKNSLQPIRVLLQDTFIALGPILARLIPEAVKFAGVFLGASGPLVTFLNTLTRVLTVFNNLPGPVKSAVANLIAAKAVFSLLGGGVLIKAATSLATFVVQWRLLSAIGGGSALAGMASRVGALARSLGLLLIPLAGPAGAVVLIGAFAFAMAKLTTNWGSITNKLGPFGKSLQGLTAHFNKVNNAAMVSERGMDGFRQAITDRNGLSGAIQRIGPLLRRAADGFEDFRKRAGERWNNFWSNLADRVGNARDHVLDRVRAIVDGVVDRISALRERAGDRWNNFWQGLADRVANARERVVDRVRAIVDGVVDRIGALRDRAGDRWNSFWQGLAERVSSARERIVDRVRSIIDAVVERIAALRDRAQERWNNFWSGLAEKVQDARERIVDRVRAIIDSIAERIQSLRDRVQDRWNSFWQGLADKVRDARDKIVDGVGDIRETVIDRFQAFFKDLGERWRRFWGETLPNFISNVRGEIGRRVDLIKNEIMSRVGTLIETVRKRWYTFWHDTLPTVVANARAWIGDKVGGIKDEVISRFNSMVDPILNFWKNRIWQPALDYLRTKIDEMMRAINGLKTRIQTSFVNLPGQVNAIFKKIGAAMTNPISSARDTLKNIFNGILTAIANVLKTIGVSGADTLLKARWAADGGSTSGDSQRQQNNQRGREARTPGGIGGRAKGGVDQKKGGVAGPRQPRIHVWGEGDYDEAYLTLDPKVRRNNNRYAQWYAKRTGGEFIPGPEGFRDGGIVREADYFSKGGRKRKKAKGKELPPRKRSSKIDRTAPKKSGGKKGKQPITPETRRRANITEGKWRGTQGTSAAKRSAEKRALRNDQKYGTSSNTYKDHPGGRGSIDYWGRNGRGDPMSRQQKKKIDRTGMRDLKKGKAEYMISNGRRYYKGSDGKIHSEPFNAGVHNPNDDGHYQHTHITYYRHGGVTEFATGGMPGKNRHDTLRKLGLLGKSGGRGRRRSDRGMPPPRAADKRRKRRLRRQDAEDDALRRYFMQNRLYQAKGGVVGPPWNQRAAGPGEGTNPTTYDWAPWVRGIAKDIQSHVPPTSINTYANHGGRGEWGEEHSVDFWGPAGRGDYIANSTGDSVYDYIYSNHADQVFYTIWEGMIRGWGQNKPYTPVYAGDTMHYEHLHSTFGGTGAPDAFGVHQIANPKQKRFEKLWKKTVAATNWLLAPFIYSDNMAAKALGGTAQYAREGIGRWIDDKIPDMIPDPNSGMGMSGTGDSAPMGAGSSIGFKSYKGPHGGSPAQNRQMGKDMAKELGLSKQWNAIDYVFMHESGWDRFADNPTSDAYGIPQANPYTKLPYHGEPSGGSWAQPQLDWGLGYMVSRYGSPKGAYNSWRNQGYYAKGGTTDLLARIALASGATPFARGGIANGPQHAVLGERGREMVTPLDNSEGRRQAMHALGTDGLSDEVKGLRRDMNHLLKNVELGRESQKVILTGSRERAHEALSSDRGKGQVRSVIEGQKVRNRIQGLERR